MQDLDLQDFESKVPNQPKAVAPNQATGLAPDQLVAASPAVQDVPMKQSGRSCPAPSNLQDYILG